MFILDILLHVVVICHCQGQITRKHYKVCNMSNIDSSYHLRKLLNMHFLVVSLGYLWLADVLHNPHNLNQDIQRLDSTKIFFIYKYIL